MWPGLTVKANHGLTSSGSCVNSATANFDTLWFQKDEINHFRLHILLVFPQGFQPSKVTPSGNRISADPLVLSTSTTFQACRCSCARIVCTGPFSLLGSSVFSCMFPTPSPLLGCHSIPSLYPGFHDSYLTQRARALPSAARLLIQGWWGEQLIRYRQCCRTDVRK